MVTKLVRLAIQSEAFRQSVILTAGTAVTGVIMAVAMIVVSRLLGPEKFGVFSVSIAIMAILSKGVDMGMNQLIPRLLNKWSTNEQKVLEVIAQMHQWKIFLLIFTLFIGLLLTPLITRSLNYPYIDMVLLAVIGAVIIAIYEYVYLILSAKHEFLWVSILSIIQALIKGSGFVLLFLLFIPNVTFVGLIYYVAPLIALLVVWVKFKQLFLIKPKAASQEVKDVFSRYIGHTFIGVMAITLIGNIDVLFVQRYLNTFDTGIYSGASRIAAFIGFAAASIGGVLNNRVSRYEDVALVKKYLLKSLSIVFISIVGFLLFLPFAKLSIMYSIGPDYLPGLPALIILVLNAFLSLAIVPYISFFYRVDHPKFFSVGGILQVSIITIVNMLFLSQYGIMAAAWARTLATIIFGLFTAIYVLYALRKLERESYDSH